MYKKPSLLIVRDGFFLFISGYGYLEIDTGSMSSKKFIQALLEENISGLTKVPKADLHNHSIYGTRIEHIESWIGHPVPHPPASMKSLNEMIGYTRKSLYPCIDSREGFEFTSRSALRDEIEDGVAILEMSMDVRFISFFGSSPDPFVFIHDLVESTKPDIHFRPVNRCVQHRVAFNLVFSAQSTSTGMKQRNLLLVFVNPLWKQEKMV